MLKAFTYTMTKRHDGLWQLKHSSGDVVLSDGSIHRVRARVMYSSYDRSAVVSIGQSIKD